MTESEFQKHLEAAEKSPKEIAAAVSGLPPQVLRYKPSPDKWSILEILGHLADIEIVYAHRLRQMLADKKPVIAPMDQDEWAKNLGYIDTAAPELVALYGLNRHHNLRLLRRLKPGDLEKIRFPPRIPTAGDGGHHRRENGGPRHQSSRTDRATEEGSRQEVATAHPAPAVKIAVYTYV